MAIKIFWNTEVAIEKRKQDGECKADDYRFFISKSIITYFINTSRFSCMYHQTRLVTLVIYERYN